jgi:hypothetical protein
LKTTTIRARGASPRGVVCLGAMNRAQSLLSWPVAVF